MTMFDSRVAAVIDNFGCNWGTPEHKFRQYHSLGMTDEGDVVFRCRTNGQEKEYLRISQEQYEKCIRLPVQTARQGSTSGNRFFAWHWLEETNQLSKFFNTLKEMQNA